MKKKMKKNFYVLIIISSIALTSCSSGWNCQTRYCKAPAKAKVHKTTTPQQVNA